MRELRMSPQDYDILLDLIDPIEKDSESAMVNIKLGSDVAGSYTVTKIEAAAISKWFADLAKNLK